MKKLAVGIAILTLILGSIRLTADVGDIPFDSPTEVVKFMIDNPDVWYFKTLYFAYISKSEIRELTLASTDAADLTMFKLLLSSRVFVPNNLTDDNLASKAKKNGRALKRLAAAKIRTIPRGSIHAFTNYPMESMQGLVNHISAPNYKYKKLPYGAPMTTWASESYAYVFHQVRSVELVQRSVVLKFALERGYLEIPRSVDVVFRWNGQESIPIDLDYISWGKKDIKDLELLVDNPYWGAMAKERLALLTKEVR